MAAIEVFDSGGSCGLYPAGWLALSSGAAITRMPTWDAGSNVFCRWGAAEGAARLGAMGLRLPTWQELEELHKAALFIAPVTLPTAAMAAADPKNNYPGSPLMGTLEWCRIHDAAVFDELTAAGWNGQPVANAGKHWCYDGAIYGWWRKDGTMIQPLSYFHEPGGMPHVPPLGAQRDYATTCHAVAPKGTPPPAPPSGSLFPPGSAGASSRTKGALAGAGVAVLSSIGVGLGIIFGV